LAFGVWRLAFGNVSDKAAAERNRLARLAHSAGLTPDQQKHRILPGDVLTERGTKTRFRANVAALKIIK